jgi:hypothetical protein
VLREARTRGPDPGRRDRAEPLARPTWRPSLQGGVAAGGLLLLLDRNLQLGIVVFFGAAAMSAVIDRHLRSLAATILGAWLVYGAWSAWYAIIQGHGDPCLGDFSWVFVTIRNLIIGAIMIAVAWLPVAGFVALIARSARPAQSDPLHTHQCPGSARSTRPAGGMPGDRGRDPQSG